MELMDVDVCEALLGTHLHTGLPFKCPHRHKTVPPRQPHTCDVLP